MRIQRVYIIIPIFCLFTFILKLNHAASESNINQKFCEHIQKGYIELGMTKENVRTSWGEPKAIQHKKTKKYDEVWIYVPNWKFRNKLYFNNGILVKTEPAYLVVSQMEGHGVMPFQNVFTKEERFQGKVKIGMTREQVKENWGTPDKIIRKQGKGFDEIWIYIPHRKFKNYLYFQNGILTRGEPNPEDLI